MHAVQHYEAEKKGLLRVIGEKAEAETNVDESDISKYIGRKIQYEEKINAELSGGIRILINDELLVDGSIKSQLDRLFGQKIL